MNFRSWRKHASICPAPTSHVEKTSPSQIYKKWKLGCYSRFLTTIFYIISIFGGIGEYDTIVHSLPQMANLILFSRYSTLSELLWQRRIPFAHSHALLPIKKVCIKHVFPFFRVKTRIFDFYSNYTIFQSKIMHSYKSYKKPLTRIYFCDTMRMSKGSSTSLVTEWCAASSRQQSRVLGAC